MVEIVLMQPVIITYCVDNK